MQQDIAETATRNSSTFALNIIPPARRLSFLALVSVIFFTVSGGAFGLEPLVGTVGPIAAIMLIIITPLLWGIPIALMVSELSSAIPEEGGYYVWVRRGLGDFWGVQEGWWTICYTAVDMAIYPVLFLNYLAYFIPSLALDEDGSSSSWGVFAGRWLIAIALISVALMVNWRGARAVGQNALVNVYVVLAPFVLLAIIAFMRSGGATAAINALVNDLNRGKETELLALGLATVLWNYCGWDNVSTFAGEVNNPQRNYPRAFLAAVPLIVCAYVLPVMAGLSVTTDARVWNEATGWPVIAETIGGRWLGLMLAVAALLSAWSLFNSQLLYVSRLPFVMARDGWLPKALTRVSTRTGVPTTALLAACAISAIFSALPFSKLVIIDIILYSAALILEFAALIALRIREPEMARPFRVPGGWPMLALITLAPTCFGALVIAATFSDPEANPKQIIIVIAAMTSGIALYFLNRKRLVNGK